MGNIQHTDTIIYGIGFILLIIALMRINLWQIHINSQPDIKYQYQYLLLFFTDNSFCLELFTSKNFNINKKQVPKISTAKMN